MHRVPILINYILKHLLNKTVVKLHSCSCLDYHFIHFTTHPMDRKWNFESVTDQRKHVLIGVTGSVATIKIAELARELTVSATTDVVDVRVIATKASLHFFDPSQLDVPVYTDEDEWTTWQKRGDPVLHIELRRWAHLFIIAPLDANTLAKLANGLCNNLLTSVARAWDLSKPLVFCPAMNTHMYEHPLTAKQRRILREEFGYHEVEAIEKMLMCKDVGIGAMASVETIVKCAKAYL